jgi:DNA-binding response OmpR family regulator
MQPFVKLDDIVVVIVDDDDDIRFSLAKYLIVRGATVFPCSDAKTGLEAVRTHQPNIVLSDIGLPHRDGFQLLQDIRSLDAEQGGEVPVIAMTAFEGIVDGNRSVDGAFQAHLHKPFRPDQLLTAIVSNLG